MKLVRALKRLWRLATCEHRNAANWGIVFGGELPAEMHFCLVCGRLLMACTEADQPQHNKHWLMVDHLDDRNRRYSFLPHHPRLRELAERFK